MGFTFNRILRYISILSIAVAMAVACQPMAQPGHEGQETGGQTQQGGGGSDDQGQGQGSQEQQGSGSGAGGQGQQSGSDDQGQDQEGGQGQGGGDIQTAVTATLSFSEFTSEDDAKKYVAGYGQEKKYTNSYGEWTICAYYYKGGFQLNSGKVAYIGTPVFPGAISELTITYVSTFNDKYYICSEKGTSSVAGLLTEVHESGSSTTIDVSKLNRNQLYIRAAACVRISEIKVTYGGSGNISGEESGSGEGGSGSGSGEDSGSGEGGSGEQGQGGSQTASGGWYELPAMNDADHNGIDDRDNSLYYASHKFKMNGRSYRNYTVCYSGRHHCPMWVAAPRHKMYEGSTGRTDAYGVDPSIPSSVQCNSKETGGGCNKGHMLGSKERTCCSEANRQVFYYTNIAPQLSTGFNNGGGGWNLLEDYVDSRVVRDTLYEVVGAYFENYTDGYAYSADPATISFGGRNDVIRPSMFYYVLLSTKSGTTGKPLSACTSSELKCVAFVRSHTNSLKGQKPSAREMMSVADLEKITGFTYFVNVPQAPKNSFLASDWGL